MTKQFIKLNSINHNIIIWNQITFVRRGKKVRPFRTQVMTLIKHTESHNGYLTPNWVWGWHSWREESNWTSLLIKCISIMCEYLAFHILVAGISTNVITYLTKEIIGTIIIFLFLQPILVTNNAGDTGYCKKWNMLGVNDILLTKTELELSVATC